MSIRPLKCCCVCRADSFLSQSYSFSVKMMEDYSVDYLIGNINQRKSVPYDIGLKRGEILFDSHC